MISNRTFSRPLISARAGRPSPPASPTALTFTLFAKIPSARGSSMPAPKRARGFPSMTARTGKRCSSICRQLRSTTSSSTVTIWSSPPMAARSGCSMTSARCARRTPPSSAKRRTCSRLVPQFARAWDTPNAAATPSEHIPAKAGLNQFTWDLRYESPKKIPAAVYDEGEPSGPLVLPGNYQARLTVGAKNFTAPLGVIMDPRVKTSAEDLRKQFDLLLKMCNRQDEMNKTILAIRDLRGQLESLEKRLGANEPAKPLVTASTDLRKKISAIEEELIQVNSKASEDELNYPTKLNSKLGYLQNAVDSADAQPTEAELGVYAELDLQLESQLAKWRDVLSKDVPALNEAMQKNNVPLIAPTTAKAN